ncbi:MAG: DNA adenine methylase [Termitinemataceae bacterium]|nr:MAG: DNA adenine methylase [Termitinemataceae bacterium]
MIETVINTKRKAAPLISTRNPHKKLIAFGWYGGKFSHLDWLLPQLPDCFHYCEPFAGSGAVLLNRKPASVETYNDIDGEVVNFFKVLREDKNTLIEKIALTPFSREEFGIACKLNPNITDLERARRFYIRARQVRTGLAQTASIGRWANCKNTSRSGMSGVVSRWLGGVEQLDFIAERLLRVQIENRPALDVIKLYDGKNTLFYCDPPYIHSTRGDIKAYKFEMNNYDHTKLAETLNAIEGLAAISNYDCELMDELYPSNKWSKIYAPLKTIHSTKDVRQEVLWVNYDIKNISTTLNQDYLLFEGK